MRRLPADAVVCGVTWFLLLVVFVSPAFGDVGTHEWQDSELTPWRTGGPAGVKVSLDSEVARQIFGLSEFGAYPLHAYRFERTETLAFDANGLGTLMGVTDYGVKYSLTDSRNPALRCDSTHPDLAVYFIGVLDVWQDLDDPDVALETWGHAGGQTTFAGVKFSTPTTATMEFTETGHQLTGSYLMYDEWSRFSCVDTASVLPYQTSGAWLLAASYDTTANAVTYELWMGGYGADPNGMSCVESATIGSSLIVDTNAAIRTAGMSFGPKLQRVDDDGAYTVKDDVHVPARQQDSPREATIGIDGLFVSQVTTDAATVAAILAEWEPPVGAEFTSQPNIRTDLVSGTAGGGTLPSGLGGLPDESWETSTGVDAPWEWNPFVAEIKDWLAGVFDPLLVQLSEFFWPLEAIADWGDA